MSALALKVATESRPSSRLAVKIEIPAKRCEASYEEAISRLSRSINLPGFRKGKIPRAVLLQQLGAIRIRATALESLVDGVWREAIDQAAIKPLCEPELPEGFEALLEKFQENKDLEITLETDVAPCPTLKTTKGLKAEAEPIKFDPSKIDELIEDSRKQLATLIPVEERAAAIGDVAVISFQGKFSDDGSEIEGGSSESMDLDLEKGRMIPGFIEGIIGMTIKEEKTVLCQFPKEYSNELARGREANFNITLKELKARELPALDDAFAKQASDKETLKDLHKDLEERLKQDAEQRDKDNRQQALLQALVEQLEVELPETMIQQEVRNLVEQTASNFAQQGMDVKSMFTPELVKSLMESSREEAKENLRKNLALQALAESEKLTINDEELEKKYKEVQKELSSSKNIDLEKLREAVKNDLLQEKLLKWLEENNEVTKTTKVKNSKKVDDSSAKTSSQSKSTKQASTKTTSNKKPKAKST